MFDDQHSRVAWNRQDRAFLGRSLFFFRMDSFWLVSKILVQECSNPGTATDLWDLDALALLSTRAVTGRCDDGTAELLKSGVETFDDLLVGVLRLWGSGLLSLHETLETLLLAFQRTRGVCSTKSKLTIKVSTDVRRRAKVVGRGHSAGYEGRKKWIRKSVLTARPRTVS